MSEILAQKANFWKRNFEIRYLGLSEGSVLYREKDMVPHIFRSFTYHKGTVCVCVCVPLTSTNSTGAGNIIGARSSGEYGRYHLWKEMITPLSLLTLPCKSLVPSTKILWDFETGSQIWTIPQLNNLPNTPITPYTTFSTGTIYEKIAAKHCWLRIVGDRGKTKRKILIFNSGRVTVRGRERARERFKRRRKE